jgi:hypothetical protein
MPTPQAGVALLLPGRRHRRFLLLGIVVAVWGYGGAELRAQDMEPRAYSASPIGTNFLVASYLRTAGSVSLDPALPISNVKATINTFIAGYQHTFDLLGQTASLALAIPYFDANVSGDVQDSSKEVNRLGVGDIRLRFATNLIGGAALRPAEFASRKSSTTLGASLTIVAPTGDYNPAHLVNIGSNRWAFRPEIGLSQPFGNWFGDVAVGSWLFTENEDFLQIHRRGEDPLMSVQVHGGYVFRPGLWVAADATRYIGGNTVVDGVTKHDFQSATRYGVTLSAPLGEGWSAKFAWTNALAVRNVGRYDTISFAVQYRWFDE